MYVYIIYIYIYTHTCIYTQMVFCDLFVVLYASIAFEVVPLSPFTASRAV